jgi:hypothetical protein
MGDGIDSSRRTVPTTKAGIERIFHRRRRGFSGGQERIEERDSKGKIHYQIPRLLIPGDGKRTREINDVVVGLVRRFVLDYRARCEEWDFDIDDFDDTSVALDVSIAISNADFYSMQLAINSYFKGPRMAM